MAEAIIVKNMKLLIPFNEDLPSRENLLRKRAKSKDWMLGYLLVLTLLAGVLLFFIKIDLSIQVPGHLRPVSLPYSLKSLVQGRVEIIHVVENQKVTKGQLLLLMESEELVIKLREQENRIKNTREHLRNLKFLLIYIEDRVKLPKLSMLVYGAEFRTYVERLRQVNGQINHLESVLKRNLPLVKKEMISELEIENKRNAYEVQIQNRARLQAEKKLEWQRMYEAKTIELEEYLLHKRLLEKQQSLYKLRAPFDGFIQNIRMGKGAFLNAGDVAMEVIPDTSLVVELWISPQKIAHLNPNQRVDFEINAYGSPDWGRFSGYILSIADDVTLVNNKLLYKVICSISDHEQIGNRIKKGMNLTAHLFLNELTFFEYIFKNINEWVKISNGKVPVNV